MGSEKPPLLELVCAAACANGILKPRVRRLKMSKACIVNETQLRPQNIAEKIYVCQLI